MSSFKASLLIKYISAPFSNVTGNLTWDIFHGDRGRGSRTSPLRVGMPILKAAPCRYSAPGVFLPPHCVLPRPYRQTGRVRAAAAERRS